MMVYDVEKNERLVTSANRLCANRLAEEDAHMIRHWVKMLVLALLILIQTACPKLLTKQQNTSTGGEAQEQGGTG